MKLTRLIILVFFISLLTACKKSDDSPKTPNADEYVTWDVGGKYDYLATPSDTFELSKSSANNYYLQASQKSTSHKHLYFSFTDTTVGTQSSNYFSLYTSSTYYVQSSTPIQLTFSKFGARGDYVIGTYTGTVKDSSSASTFTINGEFKVRRQ